MAEDTAAAWASIVLAEAAVSYAHAVAGPRLPDDERQVAAQRYDEHDRARDDALLALTATGAEPVAIPTFFELPNEVATPEQARALLGTVEARLAVSYADLTAVLPLPERQIGLDRVLQATLRAQEWGATAGPWGAVEPAA